MKGIKQEYRLEKKQQVVDLIESNGWDVDDISSLLGVTVRCIQQHLSKVPVPFSFVLKIYGLLWIKENVARATLKVK